MTGNREKYPKIIQEPKTVEVFGREYIVYKFIFNGLTGLYNYLKSNPEINKNVFGREMASINNDCSFAGKPYNQALEQLINSNDQDYRNFLTISTKSQVKNLKRGAKFQSTNSVAGGIVRPHALAVGDIKAYTTTKIIKTNSVVNIHAITNYLGYTTSDQVYNKAVILTNIIHALEKRGYKVNVNAFSASEVCGEIIDVDLNIKRNNAGVNYQALYRALCNVEFLRRIIFRVRETSDVKGDWSGYGRTISEKFAREYLKIDKDDLYFGTPSELGISGNDISSDFENAVSKLGLDGMIDVERAKVLIKKSMDNNKKTL